MATVIYARKSSERDDRQVLSLDAQIRVLKEVARRENIVVSEVIQEAKSAKSPYARPEFQRMVSQIEKGRITGILVWHVNRLSRNSIDGSVIAHYLQTGKLNLIKTPERTYWPEDNALILAVETGMAVNYIQNLSKDVKRGLREKVEQGWYHGCAPFGYVNNPATRQIDPHPIEFPILKQAWKLFLSGAYSVQEVQREVERMGLKGRQRGGTDRPVNRTTLYRIFANSFYAGELKLNDKTYLGKHLPMITAGEYWQAQALLGRKTFVRPKRKSFKFSGTLKCGKCGCAVIGEVKRKVFKTERREVEYTYYHCSGSRGCPKISITEPNLMASIEKFYAKVEVTDKHVESWCRLALWASATKDSDALNLANINLDAELQVVESRIARVEEFLLDGKLDPEDYRELKNGLKQNYEEKIRQRKKATALWQSFDDFIKKKLEAASELRKVSELSDVETKGHLWCIGQEHTLTLGKLHLEVDPIVAKVMSLELPAFGSGSDKPPENKDEISYWSANYEQVRNFVYTEYSGAIDDELKRMSGPVKTGPPPSLAA